MRAGLNEMRRFAKALYPTVRQALWQQLVPAPQGCWLAGWLAVLNTCQATPALAAPALGWAMAACFTRDRVALPALPAPQGRDVF
jgi:hypothetical protein